MRDVAIFTAIVAAAFAGLPLGVVAADAVLDGAGAIWVGIYPFLVIGALEFARARS